MQSCYWGSAKKTVSNPYRAAFKSVSVCYNICLIFSKAALNADKCSQPLARTLLLPLSSDLSFLANGTLKTTKMNHSKSNIHLKKQDLMILWNSKWSEFIIVLYRLPKIDKLPLFKRKIVVSDNIEETQRAEIVKKIEQFGGKVMRKMTACIFILICTNGTLFWSILIDFDHA